MLEHRLHVLGDLVTTFVLVEAAKTHQGAPKPLHFSSHRERFGPWLPRIHHVVVDLEAEGAWAREQEQRRAYEAAVDALGADPDDLVLVGDCDEIPSRSAIERLAAAERPPTRLHMRNAVYWANTVRPRPWDDGTVAFRWRDREEPALGMLLGRPGGVWRGYPDRAALPDAGWHFGDQGDAVWLAAKLRSFAHAELLRPAYAASAHLQRCRRLGVDWRSGELLRLIPRSELPSEVTSLEVIRADLVREQPFPPLPIRLAYGAFSANRRLLPDRLVRWSDAHIVPFLALAALPIVLADRVAIPVARNLRRVLRQRLSVTSPSA